MIAAFFGSVLPSMASGDTSATGTLSVSMWQQMNCDGCLGDASFRGVGDDKSFGAVLPSCASDSTDACVESLEMQDLDSNLWQSFSPSAPILLADIACKGCWSGIHYSTWSSDTAMGIPPGSTPSKWSSGNNTEVVMATLSATCPIPPGSPSKTCTLADGSSSISTWGFNLSMNPLPGMKLPKARFRVVVRLNSYVKNLNTFMHGRLTNAAMDITSTGRLTVEGEPAIVPIAKTKVFQLQNLPDDVRKYFVDMCSSGHCLGTPDPSTWNANTPSQNFSFGQGPDQKNVYNFWSKYLFSSSSRENSVWSVESTGQSGSFGCPSDPSGINGLVTTNANIFDPGPPTWNQQDQSLDFFVASPHLLSGGALASGNYDLSLSNVVAKCLWKVGRIPSEATISVTYDDALADVATTTLNQDAAFVQFHANNFHYSAPTIKITFPKASLDAPSPIPSPGASLSPAAVVTPSPIAAVAPTNKKVVIICLKGKTTKKIIGVSPKCPSGFRKK